MTLANNWGYVPNDVYKSSAKVIHSLIEVVAKGGSIVLGIDPKPDGKLTNEALQRMKEIGAWMQKNGEAIYDTRTVKNYRDSSTYFTQNKTRGLYYALVCLPEGKSLPSTIEWNDNAPKKGSKMILLQTGESVKWKQNGNHTTVFLPSAFVRRNETLPALAFSFQPDK
jgi:alpha-L-fucosidase